MSVVKARDNIGRERFKIPSKANATAVAHAVAEDLAGENMISNEDGVQLLAKC